MNRIEQTPEPTMEEILASIRLIISDDAKQGFGAPAGRGAPQGRSEAPRAEAAALNTIPGEDVLDLSEAFAFPEDLPAPRTMIERQATPPAPAQDALAAAAKPDAASEKPEEGSVDLPPPAEAQAPDEAQAVTNPASASRTASAWSRRELPGLPQPVAPEPKLDATSRQASKSWTQDIQMPIPDRGPVSLIPGGAAHAQGAPEVRPPEPPVAAVNAEDPLESLDEKGEAAVAAIAETLARSAAAALDAKELTKAADVDFSKLAEERKAEVSKTFANAIEKENAPCDEAPLPTLLDEVFRQDFIRQPSREAKAAEKKDEAPKDAPRERNETVNEEPLDWEWGAPAPEMLLSAPQPQPQPGPEPSSKAPEAPPAPAPENLPVKAVPLKPTEAAVPRASSPISPLEEAVRDMLRPLLVQWLDEHMPRILESAIREEITARGLLTKPDK